MVDPSSREDSAAGKHRHTKAQGFLAQNQLYDCEHMVFNLWNCLPEHRPLGSVNRDAACGLSCLAADTAETEHGGS